MPNFNDLANRFELITEKLNESLKNDLIDSDEAEFFQALGGKLQDTLSPSGKAIFTTELNQDVLSLFHKEAHEKLKKEYKDSLENAISKVQKNLDPKTTEKYAQQEFEQKLANTKQLLIKNINDKLAKSQEFSNPADKKVINTALNNYLDNLAKKYKDNLKKINSIWPQLAQLNLHIDNEGKIFKAKKPDATFSINEIDLNKLSIGEAPGEKKDWKLDIDNLSKRLIYQLANKAPDEKIHITLNVPDRTGIVRQIGDIGFQGRSPIVALLALLFFYIRALIYNDDVERMITGCEEVIKKQGIVINPDDISYTIKLLDTNGKLTVIKEKGPLSSEHAVRLQKANQELMENLNKEHKIDNKTKPSNQSNGYVPNVETEEQTKNNNSLRC